MQLPDDNTITLPDGNYDWFFVDESNADAGPFPEWDIEQLKRLVPAYVRRGDDEVRDAYLFAWAHMSNLQRADICRIMKAHQSPRFAWGAWLKMWGDDRHLQQSPDETDAAFRDRLLSDPVGIAPQAIRDAVRALLSLRFQPKQLPVFVEPKVDFAFWRSASAPASAPRCFWQSRASGHGRIWASGRRTGLRTAGAYWVSAGTKTDQNPSGTVAPPALWVMLPATLSSKRGGWGSTQVVLDAVPVTQNGTSNLTPLAAQPARPQTLYVGVTDPSRILGSLLITGTDATGSPISETVSAAIGSFTTKTVNRFASVTAVTATILPHGIAVQPTVTILAAAPHGAFWGSHGSSNHTVWISASAASLLEQAVRALANLVLAGVVWSIRVDPALAFSIAR